MLDDPFADLEGQVQSREARVPLLELLDDAQSVNIVIKALAKARHLPVQLLLASMREGGMPDVVRQRQCFRQILVQLQDSCGGARNLRHLNCVSQPVPKVIGHPLGKNLGLGFQTAERPGMYDPVAVPLKIIAVGMGWLRKSSSPAARDLKSEPSQHDR